MARDNRNGAARISDERRRQTEKEGFSLEEDERHSAGQLALAAACYATPRRLYERIENAESVVFEDPWPWSYEWDKRPYRGNVVKNNETLSREMRIRQLEKAGALIAAEIDRLLRQKVRK